MGGSINSRKKDPNPPKARWRRSFLFRKFCSSDERPVVLLPEPEVKIEEKPQKKFDLTALPANIEMKIIESLKLRDLYNLGRTCKHWWNIATNVPDDHKKSIHWNGLTINDNNFTVQGRLYEHTFDFSFFKIIGRGLTCRAFYIEEMTINHDFEESHRYILSSMAVKCRVFILYGNVLCSIPRLDHFLRFTEHSEFRQLENNPNFDRRISRRGIRIMDSILTSITTDTMYIFYGVSALAVNQLLRDYVAGRRQYIGTICISFNDRLLSRLHPDVLFRELHEFIMEHDTNRYYLVPPGQKSLQVSIERQGLYISRHARG